jgi:hypothetical protein
VLNRDFQTYKIRVYLLSAQNLTATGTVIDWKSRLAGMTALCTANPYPVIQIGDGINDEETRRIKYQNEREKSEDGALNP